MSAPRTASSSSSGRGADRAEILSEVGLPLSKNSIGGSEGTEEQVFAGAAISRGRVFFVSSDAIYAIGPKQRKTLTGWAADEPAVTGEGAPAYVQVSPTELVLEPGRTVKLAARSFDARGRLLREEKATWSLEGLKGTVADGALTVGPDKIEQAGLIKATVGSLTGEARARVARPLPWSETFDSMAEKTTPAGWVNAGAPLGPWWLPRWTARRCSTRRRRTPCSSEGGSSSALSNGRITRCRPTCARRHAGA